MAFRASIQSRCHQEPIRKLEPTCPQPYAERPFGKCRSWLSSSHYFFESAVMFDARELRNALVLAICGTAIVVALFALIVEANSPSHEALLTPEVASRVGSP